MKSIKDLRDILPTFEEGTGISAETYLSKLKYIYNKNYVSKGIFIEAVPSTLVGLPGDWFIYNDFKKFGEFCDSFVKRYCLM